MNDQAQLGASLAVLGLLCGEPAVSGALWLAGLFLLGWGLGRSAGERWWEGRG